ncbi:hypothetical protein Tco_0872752 [Tanacetum coccineum]
MLISGIRAQGIKQHSNSRFNHHSRKSALDKKQRMKKLIDGMEQFGQDFLFRSFRRVHDPGNKDKDVYMVLEIRIKTYRKDAILDYLEALVSHYKAARSRGIPMEEYEAFALRRLPRRMVTWVENRLAAKEKGRESSILELPSRRKRKASTN